MLPRSLRIPLCYDPAETPLYRGGFADVWKGRYDGREVSAKVVRVYSASDLERVTRVGCPRPAAPIDELTVPVQRFCSEVVAWKTLRHPNVLPLLGVTMTESRFVIVSELMANGNINEFVRAHVDADRLGLVRLSLEVLVFACQPLTIVCLM